jgi:[ribosomal protein S18]-alanine N-acetyltransferase
MIPADMAAIHALCFTTPRPWSADEIAAFEADPLCFTLTEAEAFLIGRAVAGEAELLTLAVAPQARRRGLGARLVSRFLYQARLRGAETAFLEVADGNTPALGLYNRMGFTRTGRRRGYYRLPDGQARDAIILTRQLTNTAATPST